MACHKRSHPTRRQAERAMYAQWRKARPGKVPVRVYSCGGHWHTTSWPLDKWEQKCATTRGA
jgi:hypothetical protein